MRRALLGPSLPSVHSLLHSYLTMKGIALLAPFLPPLIQFLLLSFVKMVRNPLVAPFPHPRFISYYFLITRCAPDVDPELKWVHLCDTLIQPTLNGLNSLFPLLYHDASQKPSSSGK